MQSAQTTLDNYKDTLSVKGLFYRGVVESIKDPLKLDRVQVRVFGIHTDKIQDAPTESLPWAEVLTSNMFGTSTGIGISSSIVEGTWVWVFFENNDFQKPVVIGLSKGIPTEKQEGAFTDPNNVFPLQDRLNESDTNRLHRNEKYKETTLHKERDSNLEKNVGVTHNSNWSMPTELNTKTQYPYNTVLETRGGHIIEIDDTPGNERLHIWHKSGTFSEFRPDGTVSTKIVKDKFQVINKNLYQLIKGDSNITINKNSNTTIHGNENEDTDGVWDKHIGGVTTIKGDSNIYVKAPNIYLN